MFAKEVPTSIFDRKFLFIHVILSFKRRLIIFNWKIYKFFSLFEGRHNIMIEVISYLNFNCTKINVVHFSFDSPHHRTGISRYRDTSNKALFSGDKSNIYDKIAFRYLSARWFILSSNACYSYIFLMTKGNRCDRPFFSRLFYWIWLQLWLYSLGDKR